MWKWTLSQKVICAWEGSLDTILVYFLPTNRIIYLWLCLCKAKLYFIHLVIFWNTTKQAISSVFLHRSTPKSDKNAVVKSWRTISSVRGRRITVKDVFFKSLRCKILSPDWLIYSLCKLKGLKYLLYAGVSFQAERRTFYFCLTCNIRLFTHKIIIFWSVKILEK